MNIDYALVQTAGPGVPPAMPAEPASAAADFGAVMGSLLAVDVADAASLAGDAGAASAGVPAPTTQALAATLAALAEVTVEADGVVPPADIAAPAAAPAASGRKGAPPLGAAPDDATEPGEAASDDGADLSALPIVVPIPMAMPIAEAAPASLPGHVSGAAGGDDTATIDRPATALAATAGLPTLVPVTPAPAAAEVEPVAVASEQPVPGEALAADASRAAASPTAPPSADGPDTPPESAPEVTAENTAAVEAGAAHDRTTAISSRQTASQPEPAAAGPADVNVATPAPAPARSSFAETTPMARQAAAAAGRPSPPGTGSTASGRTTEKAREPQNVTGVSRVAAGLVSQLIAASRTAPATAAASVGVVPPHVTVETQGMDGTASGAATGFATVSAGASDGATDSGSGVAAVPALAGAPFGDGGGSAPDGQSPNHQAGPSGPSTQMAPALEVSGGQPAWTTGPSGQPPASAAASFAHAAAADDPVVPQLVRALHMQLRNGIGEARLQLEPNHLGSVSVTLRVENGVVSAVITAEQPAVRHWLETHESSLRGALSDQGLQLDRLRVEPDGRGPDGRGSTGQEPPPRRRMLRKETATFELVATAIRHLDGGPAAPAAVSTPVCWVFSE